MSIGTNIKNARKAAGITQVDLAKKTNLSRSYIGDIEKDRYNPSIATLQAIAKATDTTVATLTEGTEQTPPRIGIRIPVLGRVAAGIPLEAIENIIDYEEIPEAMARKGEYFALRVHGASMEPRIHDGDVIIVKRQQTVESGEIAVVLVNGDDATVKEVKESPEGITLIGYNVAVYRPQFYSNRDIESLPIQILGKVVESRTKF